MIFTSSVCNTDLQQDRQENTSNTHLQHLHHTPTTPATPATHTCNASLSLRVSAVNSATLSQVKGGGEKGGETKTHTCNTSSSLLVSAINSATLIFFSTVTPPPPPSLSPLPPTPATLTRSLFPCRFGSRSASLPPFWRPFCTVCWPSVPSGIHAATYGDMTH